MSPAGAVVGALAGVGLLLLVLAWASPRRTPRSRGVRRGTGRQAAVAVLGGLVAAMMTLAVTALPVAALLAGAAAAALPTVVRRHRASVMQRELRAAWPDAVDGLLSSVRAGMSLPESVAALGLSGPPPLRTAFARFADDHRVTGAFDAALDRLQDDLADPVADRVCAALRLAREVGGTDLGAVLTALSAMLREDGRIRREVLARQSWTISAARLAVAAPWLTLALLCTRPEAVRAYSTPAGTVVLAVAAALSIAAYVAMKRIGRLPADERMAP